MKKEDKEAIINALEGTKQYICPKCKFNVFAREGNTKVEITEEDDCLLDTMVDGSEEFTYRCAKCDEPLRVDEMEIKEINK